MRLRRVDQDGATMRRIIHRALCRELGREDLIDAEPPERPDAA
jgi:hypothetical protein